MRFFVSGLIYHLSLITIVYFILSVYYQFFSFYCFSTDSVELLADVADGFLRRDNKPWGIYTREFVRKSREWKEAAAKASEDSLFARSQDASTVVMDRLHFAAFRHGLGNPLYPQIGDLEVQDVLGFADKNLAPGKVALVGYGVGHQELASSASHSWANVNLSKSAPEVVASKYYGGESFDFGVSPHVHYALAFQGASQSSSDYFTSLVLSQLLGDNISPSVKYGTNLSLLNGIKNAEANTFSLSYSDAGLLGVYLKADDSAAVSAAVKEAVKVLKDVASGRGKELVKAAMENTKFALASEYENASRVEKIRSYGAQVSHVF